MLAGEKIKAFVPTVKPAQARAFYTDLLGLKLLSEDNFALEFESGDVRLRVTIVPELTPQKFTVLGWDVGDIFSTIRALNDKGVFCEQYDFFEQDDLGVWISPSGAKVAWFKDPDGNILSLTEL